MVAAFSVKSQLEPSDLKDAVAEARLVREGMAERLGDIVGELVSPLIYGVLAHAPHKKLGADPSATVSNTLLAEAEKYDSHPSKQLDIVCVADLDCWYRTVAVAQNELGSEKETEHDLYFDFWRSAYEPPEYATQSMPNANPVATLVTQLWAKLAARDPRPHPMWIVVR